MTDLSELIERVNAAGGPDRELDGAIEVMARRFDAYRAGLNDTTRAHWMNNGSTVYDGNTGYDAANFTASVDAALALAGRLLPGWCVVSLSQNSRLAGDPWGCTLALYFGSDPSKNRFVDSGYKFTKPALAIVGATLTALWVNLQSQEVQG